jgi:hypothetical protein
VSNTYQKNRRRAQLDPVPGQVAVPEQVVVSMAEIAEYCLVIQPVAVGRGQALFAELPAAMRLDLIEARSFECGVVVHIYRPKQVSFVPAGGMLGSAEHPILGLQDQDHLPVSGLQ